MEFIIGWSRERVVRSPEVVKDKVEKQRAWSDVIEEGHKFNQRVLKIGQLHHLHISRTVCTSHYFLVRKS